MRFFIGHVQTDRSPRRQAFTACQSRHEPGDSCQAMKAWLRETNDFLKTNDLFIYRHRNDYAIKTKIS